MKTFLLIEEQAADRSAKHNDRVSLPRGCEFPRGSQVVLAAGVGENWRLLRVGVCIDVQKQHSRVRWYVPPQGSASVSRRELLDHPLLKYFDWSDSAGGHELPTEIASEVVKRLGGSEESAMLMRAPMGPPKRSMYWSAPEAKFSFSCEPAAFPTAIVEESGEKPGESQERIPDIFLSYAREDAEFAETLVRQIEELGATVWWDRSLKPGQAYADEIDKALGTTRALVVLLSPHSLQRKANEEDWVHTETRRAHRLNQVIIPVKLPHMPPESELLPIKWEVIVGHTQYIDYKSRGPINCALDINAARLAMAKR